MHIIYYTSISSNYLVYYIIKKVKSIYKTNDVRNRVNKHFEIIEKEIAVINIVNSYLYKYI